MKWYDASAYLLIVFAAISSAATVLFEYNLITQTISWFASVSSITFAYLSTLAYGLIGIAGIYAIITFFKLLK